MLLDSSYPVRDLDPWYVSVGDGGALRARRRLRARPGLPGGRARQRDRAPRRSCSSGCATGPIDGTRARRRRRPRARARRRSARSSTWCRTPAPSRSSTASSTRRCGRRSAGDDGAAAAPGRRVAALRPQRRRRPADYSDGLYWAVALRGLPAAVLDALAARRPARASSRASLLAAAGRRVRPVHGARVGHGRQLHAAVRWAASTGRARARSSRAVPADAAAAAGVDPAADRRRRPRLAHAAARTRACSGPTLGANVRVVELPNTTHVTSEGDGVAGGRRALRARGDPALRAGARAAARRFDTSCARPSPTCTRPAPTRCGWPDATPATLVSGPDPGARAAGAPSTVAAGALADAPGALLVLGRGPRPGAARRQLHGQGLPVRAAAPEGACASPATRPSAARAAGASPTAPRAGRSR